MYVLLAIASTKTPESDICQKIILVIAIGSFIFILVYRVYVACACVYRSGDYMIPPIYLQQRMSYELCM